jgi:hypothetical protein
MRARPMTTRCSSWLRGFRLGQCSALANCSKRSSRTKGGRPTNEETYVGADIGLSRSEAARHAGLSERQKNTGLRVASIPKEEFQAAVESDKPPTVTELAERELTASCLGGAAPPFGAVRAASRLNTLAGRLQNGLAHCRRRH